MTIATERDPAAADMVLVPRDLVLELRGVLTAFAGDYAAGTLEDVDAVLAADPVEPNGGDSRESVGFYVNDADVETARKAFPGTPGGFDGLVRISDLGTPGWSLFRVAVAEVTRTSVDAVASDRSTPLSDMVLVPRAKLEDIANEKTGGGPHASYYERCGMLAAIAREMLAACPALPVETPTEGIREPTEIELPQLPFCMAAPLPAYQADVLRYVARQSDVAPHDCVGSFTDAVDDLAAGQFPFVVRHQVDGETYIKATEIGLLYLARLDAGFERTR